MNKRLQLYFVFSLVGHLILLMVVVLYLLTEEENSNHQKVMYVASTSLISLPNRQIQNDMSPRHKTSLKKPVKQAVPSSFSNVNNRQAQEVNVNQKQVLQHETILAILHQAIALKQNYPESAVELNQKGAVKIAFSLAPNGDITNISVLESSGFSVLDTAATEAVSAISPIKTAGLYLAKPEAFSISVMFE